VEIFFNGVGYDIKFVVEGSHGGKDKVSGYDTGASGDNKKDGGPRKDTRNDKHFKRDGGGSQDNEGQDGEMDVSQENS